MLCTQRSDCVMSTTDGVRHGGETRAAILHHPFIPAETLNIAMLLRLEILNRQIIIVAGRADQRSRACGLPVF